jgi:DNA-binding NtrC family response regulator
VINKDANLLIVEDDKDLAELIKDFFISHSYNVEWVTLPSQALQKLNQYTNRALVVLTDLNLPEESGFSLMEKIKKESPSTPVIMATANDEIETAIKAIEAGAYDYVVKPLHFPQLLISVKRALHYRQVSLSHENLHKLLHSSDQEKGLGIPGVVGSSPAIQKVFDLVKRVAPTNATVYVSGESGTGKEIIARSLHKLSQRKDQNFVAINCSAIPETLLETELFGHAKGAFTGATEKKMGLFETAHMGTLFLDEIADLSLPLQAKLLRVLQERKIKRVGENTYRDIDVRIITASHKNISNEVRERRFREDLYYRLNVIPIHLPPLRERKEDILPLANYFLTKHSALMGRLKKNFTTEAAQFLHEQVWRGNVRELENIIERALVLSDGESISKESFLILPTESLLFDSVTDQSSKSKSSEKEDLEGSISENFIENDLVSLEALTNRYIQYVLKSVNNVKEDAAKILGIDRKTLYRKLQQLTKDEEAFSNASGDATEDSAPVTEANA